jgi:hypothetical protein
MTSKDVLIPLALAMTLLAGCGGDNATTTTEPRPPVVSGTEIEGRPPPAVTFGAKLSPGPAGASKASGRAVVTFDTPDALLCWRFSDLKNVNVAQPLLVRLYRNAPGRPGYPLGPFKPSGCVSEERIILGPNSHKGQQWWFGLENSSRTVVVQAHL